ncbi:MAG: AAA family ATPase [Gammaproteobacteria bacterium]|nr:AAA family ATPase [Gammaproteobacteria bacterium]
MYASSFGLTEAPFSISPDPRYLYMSRRHQEAMAHLRYGIQESGGFVLLTGEVGTGKTTICRSMLEQLPENVDVALILNPQISHNELLASLCDEIGVSYPDDASPKRLLALLNEKLIETFAAGRRTVLVIDEAQMLSREVLEQVRILTNLETTRQKLLQIILIGQPELADILSRQDLRQLAQRITARYHLEPLTRNETGEYVRYRLGIAGCHRTVFTGGALRRLYRLTQGVPRLINVVCDRAMLGAYSSDRDRVTAAMISRAAGEVFGGVRRPGAAWRRAGGSALAAALVFAAAIAVMRPEWTGVDYFDRFVTTEAPAAGDTANPVALADAVEVPRTIAQEAPPEGPVSPESGPPGGDAIPGDGDAGRELPLPELLNSTHAARGESEALQRLLRVWRIAAAGAAGEAACADIEDLYGLRCLREQGTWEDLQGHNRAAALAVNHGGRISYLVLTGLDRERATIAGRDDSFQFDRSDLEPYWDGSYVLLWRSPPMGTRTIAEHSEGVDVLWLRQTLNRVPGTPSLEVDNTYYDSSLKERVMAFQESNNLRVDGVAGVNTIIRLNSIVDPDVPRLDAAPG